MAQSIEGMAREVQGPTHLPELQTVRGIAALMVLLFHCSTYANDQPAPQAFGIVLNAPAAVITFFVLSGLMLTQALRRRGLSLPVLLGFYARRLFRIYPAVWVAVFVAILFITAAAHIPSLANTAAWIKVDGTKVDINDALRAAACRHNTMPLPLWTLSVELVGSVVVPLIAVASVRPYRLLALTILFTAASFAVGLSFPDYILFLASFCIGAAILITRPAFARIVRDDTFRWIALAGLLICLGGRSAFGLIADAPYGRFNVLVTSCGAALLIAAVYARPKAFPVLSLPPLIWLGDISYSVYLFHLPLIGLVGLALSGFGFSGGYWATTLLLTAIAVPLVCAVSALTYRAIEIPGIRLGKWITARIADGVGGARALR